MDEMLAFAEQANREYEAELYGQPAAPLHSKRNVSYIGAFLYGSHKLRQFKRQLERGREFSYHAHGPVDLLQEHTHQVICLEI